MLLALALLATAVASPSAIDLTVNGLLSRDAAFSPFPVDGVFALSWGIDADGLPPAAFLVQVAAETSDFRSAEAPATVAAAGLTWSSGVIASSATSLILPESVTSLFATEANGACSSAGRPPRQVRALHSRRRWLSTLRRMLCLGRGGCIGGGSELRTDWALPARLAVSRAPAPTRRPRRFRSS